MGLLYGLPGIRLGPGDPQTWPKRPVVLPAGWRSIEVERLWVHDQPARLAARHGADRAQLLLAGAPKAAAKPAGPKRPGGKHVSAKVPKRANTATKAA